MSNIIASNPGRIELREDNSTWNFPNTREEVAFDDSNPAAQARNEYEQHLYAEALAGEAEQLPTEPTESYNYVTHDGRAIDPSHAESVLSDAREVVTSAYDAATPEAATHAESVAGREAFIAHAAQLAGRLGDSLTIIRENAATNWDADNKN